MWSHGDIFNVVQHVSEYLLPSDRYQFGMNSLVTGSYDSMPSACDSPASTFSLTSSCRKKPPRIMRASQTPLTLLTPPNGPGLYSPSYVQCPISTCSFFNSGSGLGALVWARNGPTRQMTISDTRNLVRSTIFLLRSY